MISGPIDYAAAQLAYAAREASYKSLRLDDETDDTKRPYHAVTETHAPSVPTLIELEFAWDALTRRAKDSWRKYVKATRARFEPS